MDLVPGRGSIEHHLLSSLHLTDSRIFLHLGQPGRDKFSVSSIEQLEEVQVATSSNATISLDTCWWWSFESLSD